MSWLLHAGVVEAKAAQLAHVFKSRFDPNQPRVPAGNADGGQWTGSGGGSGGLTQVAQNDRQDDLSDIPTQMPAFTRARNAVVKRVAIRVARMALEDVVGGPVGPILNTLDLASWVIEEGGPYIVSYADPPKSLEELQSAVATPATGYNIHHIVEQTPAEQDGFPRSMIDAPDNLVRIPTLKHWLITGWYMTPSEDFDGMTPRNFLRGKDWEERVLVGRRGLVRFGVLKP